ncbi:MAG TPA: cyclopropane-fatty-acyl-phospholipid synthase family protein [Gammaproteobacteria bacterium]|nr:cyclopropane-fatty-acyl-phospholipid synthase family protein [Gammaproteobacteria bacterium]
MSEGLPRPAWYEPLLEAGLIPDPLIRRGIRRLLAQRLAAQEKAGFEAQAMGLTDWVWRLKRSPIAIATGAANAQHYEVPAGLFQMMLGPHLKYSSCLWPKPRMSLAEAEEAMLQQVCRRAHLDDGQEILDLGCGWGSFSLYAAATYPGSRVLAVSNSNSQREYIEAAARRQGLTNLEVVTADINVFDTTRRFDRVISIEMFEHMRNYQELLRRIAGWSRPGALLFVHIFCHREHAYPFEVKDASDWMARHFFTGGQMPSEDLLLHFQDDLRVQARWRVDGCHYARTCRAWLDNVDSRREEFLALCGTIYGSEQARRWQVRWRVFLMACEELFAFRGGSEWFVSHLLFRKA